MSSSVDLLAPIPGSANAGVDVRYDPVYDKLKEARKEDPVGPQGDWQYTRKTADWPQAVKLATDILATRSKDLQVGVWLTEALLRKDGFDGLRKGLEVLTGLLDRYWDDLHPALEDGDPEARIMLLDWVGERLDLAIRQVPLTRQGYDLLKYAESRAVGYEEAAAEDPSRKEARDRAIASGKLSAEMFDQSVEGTPVEMYRQLGTELGGCLEALGRLDQAGRARCGDAAPSYGKLREVLEEAQRITTQLLKKKMGVDPEVATAPADLGSLGTVSLETSTPGGNGPVSPPPAFTPGSPQEAAARLGPLATALRRANPHDPAAYLLLRGFRWGELRGKRGVDPRLLEAPPPSVRARLKALLLDRRWDDLLEESEQVMETAQGRGWLDLQRYSVMACESLGSSFHPVANAIRSELRVLLGDHPGLPEMTLMDDTPTANPETRTWLRESVLQQDNSEPPMETSTPNQIRDPRSITARSGGPQKAIEGLVRELDRETSRRGRFLRQTELAGVLVDADLAPVAKPILEELVSQIDAHKLEEWETGELVARPLALLYRCLDKLGTDDGLKETLYLRVCRLDPLQAIEFRRD